MTVKVPARREDVRRGKAGDTVVLIDPIMEMTYAIDDVVAYVWSHLRESWKLRELLNAVEVSPKDLRDALEFLSIRGLIQGARASHNEAVSRETRPSTTDLDVDSIPLKFTPGMKHECQACGSCCSATDVGPVRPSIVTKIRQQNWSHIPALSNGTDPFRKVSAPTTADGSMLLLKMHEDRCVFLSHEGLCEVHATLGAQHKPTPCRQFPYVFTEVNGALNVSLQMECRAYWDAKSASEPTSTKESALRDLLSSGAPVHRLPIPLRMDTGTLWDHDVYLRFEQTAIQQLRAACIDGAPLITPFKILANMYRTSLDSFQSSLVEADTYLSSPYWKALCELPIESGREANVSQGLAKIMASLDEFFSQASRVARKRELQHLSERFLILARASREAVDLNLGMRWDDPNAARTILTDLFISGISGRDILRHSRNLRAGLGWLVLRSWLVLSLASARARDACRVSLRITDLIDSMVTVCKMSRERAVLEFVDGLRSDIGAVFLTHLEALTSHAVLPSKRSPEE